jgi:hypothetical protein
MYRSVWRVVFFGRIALSFQSPPQSYRNCLFLHFWLYTVEWNGASETAQLLVIFVKKIKKQINNRVAFCGSTLLPKEIIKD